MPLEMIAIRFHEYGGSDKLLVEKIQRPQPGAGEVLIKVHCAGVNPVDWKYRAGYLKEFMPIQLPFTPGIDVSGTIEEVGPGVTGLKKGDAVFGLAQGGYAEYAIAKAGAVAAKPDGLSFEIAATLPVGALTAWQSLRDGNICWRLSPDVRNPPDHVRTVVSHEERPFFRHGHSHRASPDVSFGGHKAGHEIFIQTRRRSVAEGNTDQLVARAE